MSPKPPGFSDFEITHVISYDMGRRLPSRFRRVDMISASRNSLVLNRVMLHLCMSNNVRSPANCRWITALPPADKFHGYWMPQ